MREVGCLCLSHTAGPFSYLNIVYNPIPFIAQKFEVGLTYNLVYTEVYIKIITGLLPMTSNS